MLCRINSIKRTYIISKLSKFKPKLGLKFGNDSQVTAHWLNHLDIIEQYFFLNFLDQKRLLKKNFKTVNLLMRK